MSDVILRVRVQPRAKSTQLTSFEDGALHVRLHAPPVDGKANKALLKYLGREVLNIRPPALTIIRGLTSRDKHIAVDGLPMECVHARVMEAVHGP
jgi:uncharacterized protein